MESIKGQYDTVIRRHPEFKEYFPDYHPEYVPQRKHFWTIYLSLFPEEAEEALDKAWAKKLKAEREEDTHVWMHPTFFESFKEYYGKPGKPY